MDERSLPVEDILDALDLSRTEPGLPLLERLFARFNARVPFETATKIERAAAVEEPAARPRRPETFWEDFLARGTGGTCFARVAAFHAVIAELGFPARKMLGRVQADFDHAALRVETVGRPLFCDVGFPLPSLLPAEAGERETPLGDVHVERTERGVAIELGGVPEGPRRLELFDAPVSEDAFSSRWRDTFRPDSKFLSEVTLRRQLENRVVSFARGFLRVDDLHSRLTVPLERGRASRLAEIFEMDEEILASAFSRVGDPPPDTGDSTLTAYLEVDAEPEQAYAAIADPEGYRRLMSGIAEIPPPEASDTGFRIRLPAPDGGELVEDVAPSVRDLAVRVERRAAGSKTISVFKAERRTGRRYLIREATLAGPRDDLLRNDALRGRLAGSLAMDLLAWSRALARE